MCIYIYIYIYIYIFSYLPGRSSEGINWVPSPPPLQAIFN